MSGEGTLPNDPRAPLLPVARRIPCDPYCPGASPASGQSFLETYETAEQDPNVND